MESGFIFPSLAETTHKNGYVLVYESLPLPPDLLNNAMVIVFFSILPPFPPYFCTPESFENTTTRIVCFSCVRHLDISLP